MSISHQLQSEIYSIRDWYENIALGDSEEETVRNILYKRLIRNSSHIKRRKLKVRNILYKRLIRTVLVITLDLFIVRNILYKRLIHFTVSSTSSISQVSEIYSIRDWYSGIEQWHPDIAWVRNILYKRLIHTY